MALPTFVAAGAVTGSISSVAIPLPASIATDDILLLWVETENQAASISNQNGGTWAEIGVGSPQGTGTAGAGGTRLTCFWSRYNGTQGNPTVGDSGDHQRAVIVAYRGCITTGNPWDVGAGDVASSASTTVTIPGATTTVADCMVCFGVANTTDTNTTQMSSFTNANLSSVTHRAGANSTTGAGGGLNVGDGGKASAGAYGNTTGTLVASSVQGRISVALKPATAGNVTVTPGLGAPVFAGLAPVVLLTIRALAGVGAPVFTGQAPTVISTSPTVVLPGVGAPVFTGQAPTVLVTVKIPVGLGAPVFTGFAPNVVASVSASPGLGQPVFTGLAPSAVLSDNQKALPGVGQPTFTGFAPSVSVALASGLTKPGTGQPTFTGFAPIVLQSLRPAVAKHSLTVSMPPPHSLSVQFSYKHGESVMDSYTTSNDDIRTSNDHLRTSDAPMRYR